MDFSRFDGTTVQNAINVIKQKHFSELDATDFAFLKAREDMLSDADKAIYLNGENAYEVVQDSTPITKDERIINENRPLQESQKLVKDRRDEASRLLNSDPEVNPVTNDEIQEARKDKVASLKEEVAVAEKAEKDAAVEEKKAKK